MLDSVNLAHDLIQLKINNNHRIITYDIKELFVNIPIHEVLNIKKHCLQLKSIDSDTKRPNLTTHGKCALSKLFYLSR
jgi:hypothetical protein